MKSPRLSVHPFGWHAPQDFEIDGGWAVFVRFLHARHEILIDVGSRDATARSTILFESFSDGFPLFDLEPRPLAVRVDGASAELQQVADPDNVTRYAKEVSHAKLLRRADGSLRAKAYFYFVPERIVSGDPPHQAVTAP